SYYLFDYSENIPNAEDPGAYWDWREYYRDQTRYKDDLYHTLLLAGSGLYAYLYSIIDSGLSASEDFLFPTFVELSVGGFGSYTALTQTDDSAFPADFSEAVTSGISSLYPGGYADIIFRGRKFFILFGIGFSR
ncbi:unnamed protein product, partial [marine sediment metagenome]